MNRSTILKLVVALLAGAWTVASSAARADATRIDFSQVFSDGCSGEDVLITGTEELLTSVTTDSAGGTHIKLHISIHGTGLGLTSGKQYVYNRELDRQTESVPPGQAFELHVESRVRLIELGADPSNTEVITASGTITVLPDGTVIHSGISITLGCGP